MQAYASEAAGFLRKSPVRFKQFQPNPTPNPHPDPDPHPDPNPNPSPSPSPHPHQVRFKQFALDFDNLEPPPDNSDVSLADYPDWLVAEVRRIAPTRTLTRART